MARKSRYDEIVKPKLDIIEGWARNGLTLDDIANNLGFTRQTLNTYKNKHPELKEAIEQGKEVADIRVENALYRRAVGFYSEEEKVVMTKDPDGETRPEIVTVKKYHTPDVRAQIFWLKNRKPDVWKEKLIEREDIEEITDFLMIAQREPVDGNNSVEATSPTSGVSSQE